MEIDHIFITTKSKAPQADALVRFGLSEAPPNTHPGQGTANRRFCFNNMMLELLWIEDMDEVRSERTKPMRLYERCEPAEDKICPFGIALRPTTEKDETPPFQAWDYHPVYLPDSLKIQIADNTPLTEPMYFYLFFAQRQDKAPAENRHPMNHKVPLKEVTSVDVYINQDAPLSDAAGVLNKLHNVSVKQSKANFIELEFDNGILNKSKDFRPELPLVFKW